MAKTATKPKPNLAPPPAVVVRRVCAGCDTAAAIEAGHVHSSVTAAEWHRHCRGGYGSDARERVVCSCSCHDHDNPPRCLVCADDTELVTGAGPNAGKCVDQGACHERHRARLYESPRYQKLLAAQAAGVAARAARSSRVEDQATPTRAPTAARPTVGRCEHCGAPTAGGRFAAGHDAKLKGLLVREANGNSDEGWSTDPEAACLELLLRGWPTKSVKNTAAMDSASHQFDVQGQSWLFGRVVGRIGQ